MDALTSANLGARRNEDIALDLLKFVSVTAGVGRAAAPSTGFSGAAGAKPEEHVHQLLALYGRCLKVVEGQAEPEMASQEAATPERSPIPPDQLPWLKENQAPQGWTEQR